MSYQNPTFVQSAIGVEYDTNPVTINLGSMPTNGNLLILTFAAVSSGKNPRVSSISQTNVTWSLVINDGTNGGGETTSEIWKGVVGASAGTQITVTQNTSGTGSNIVSVAAVSEWRGLSGNVDQTNTNQVGSGTSVTSPTTGTTTQTVELVIASMAPYYTASFSCGSPTNSFTQVYGGTSYNNGGSYWETNNYLYYIANATGQFSTTATASPSQGGYNGCIATFFAAPTSAAPITYVQHWLW